MLLPKHCCVRLNGKDCYMSSSYIVSITSLTEEYMIGVVCTDHRDGLQKRLKVMQLRGNVPAGDIKIQPVKIVSTDCIKGSDEDYDEVSSKRDITCVKKDV
jgi:hypothetical protein